MKRMNLLYFALGLLVVLGMGQMTLHNDGVQFPDGSLQTTAARTLRFLGTAGVDVPPLFGHLGMTRQCQQTFGAEARMCTSADILSTTSLPEPESWSRGWVRPVINHIAHGSDSLLMMDASGVWIIVDTTTPPIAGGYSFDCRSWSEEAGLGLAFDRSETFPEGRFYLDSCVLPGPMTGIACCGPEER